MSAAEARAAPGWLIPAVIAVAVSIQFVAFGGGVVTPDGVFQYEQAISGLYDDWHPPVMAWLWRQLLRFGPGSGPFLVFDLALYWAGVAMIAEAVRRRGRGAAFVILLATALSPIAIGQLGSILKDSLLAASCTAALGLALTGESLPRRWGGVAGGGAGLLLVLATATRVNAILATAPLLGCLLPSPAPRGRGRSLVTVLAGAAALSASSWLINQAMLRPHHARPFFSLVNFDLGGIVAHGGASGYPGVPDGEVRRMTARCYDPALYNPGDSAACEAVEDRLVDEADRRGLSPATIWVSAIARSPWAYLRHRIAHTNRNWRLLVRAVPQDAVYLASAPNDHGLGAPITRLGQGIAQAANLLAWSPLGRPATWMAIAWALLVIAPKLRNRAIVTALGTSALAYGGGYALVSVAPDLRYNLWTMLAAGFGLALAAAGCAEPIGRRRWLVATVPVVLVIAGECLWLALALPAL